jgi:hypothetical protein
LKNWLKWVGVALVLLLVVRGISTKYYRGSQEEPIYEAAVRYLAANPTGGCNPNGCNLFFVKINGKDASPEFLKRFAGAPFSVRKGSDADQPSFTRNGSVVKDTTGNGQGMFLNFNQIMWRSSSEAHAWAGGYGFITVPDGASWRVTNLMIAGG